MQICINPQEDDLITEYRKCEEDPIYFISKYITSKHPTKGDIAFGLYPFQQDILKVINRSQSKAGVLNVARQMGLTHVITGYAAWHLIFNARKTILSIHRTVSDRQSFNAEVLRKIQTLPSWLRPRIDAYTVDSIRTDNGAILKCEIFTRNTGRGMSVSTVFLHNVDTYHDQEEFMNIAMNAIPGLIPTGKVILTTSGIKGGPVGELLKQCRDDKNHEYLEVKWSAHPERGEEWRDYMLSICSPETFAREFECKEVEEI